MCFLLLYVVFFMYYTPLSGEPPVAKGKVISFFITAVKGLVLGFLLLYVAFFHVLHAFERCIPCCKGKSYIVFLLLP